MLNSPPARRGRRAHTSEPVLSCWRRIPAPLSTLARLALLALLLGVPPGFPAAEKPRVIVSTDIGGTDFDDFQSLVHVLLYADLLDIEGLITSPYGAGAVRFRFCPKEAKTYRYAIRSNAPALDGRSGAITSVLPNPDAALMPDPARPNWWTDDPSPAVAEGPHLGARTISQWREDYLRDFAARLERCRSRPAVVAPAADPRCRPAPPNSTLTR